MCQKIKKILNEHDRLKRKFKQEEDELFENLLPHLVNVIDTLHRNRRPPYLELTDKKIEIKYYDTKKESEAIRETKKELLYCLETFERPFRKILKEVYQIKSREETPSTVSLCDMFLKSAGFKFYLSNQEKKKIIKTVQPAQEYETVFL